MIAGRLIAASVLVWANIALAAFGSECQVSPWAQWRDCIGNCIFAMRVRNRIVMKPPFPAVGVVKGVLVMEPCPPLYQIQQCMPTRCLTDESGKAAGNGVDDFAKQQEERSRPVDGHSDDPTDEILNLAKSRLKNGTVDAHSLPEESEEGAVSVEMHNMQLNSSHTVFAKSPFRPIAVIATEEQMQKVFKQLLAIQTAESGSVANAAARNLTSTLLEYEEDVIEYEDEEAPSGLAATRFASSTTLPASGPDGASTSTTTVPDVGPSAPQESRVLKIPRLKPKWGVLRELPATSTQTLATTTRTSSTSTTPTTTASTATTSTSTPTATTTISTTTTRTQPTPKPRRRRTTTTTTTTTTARTEPTTTSTSTTTTISTTISPTSSSPPTSSAANINSSDPSAYDYVGYEDYFEAINENTTIIWLNKTKIQPAPEVHIGSESIISSSPSTSSASTASSVSTRQPAPFASAGASTTTSAALPTSISTLGVATPLPLPNEVQIETDVTATMWSQSASSSSATSNSLSTSSVTATFVSNTDSSPTAPTIAGPLQSSFPAPVTFVTGIDFVADFPFSQANPSTAPPTNAFDLAASVPTPIPIFSSVSMPERVATGEPGSLYRPSAEERKAAALHSNIRFPETTTLGIATGEPADRFQSLEPTTPTPPADGLPENRVLPVLRSGSVSLERAATVSVTNSDVQKVATGEPGSWFRWGRPGATPSNEGPATRKTATPKIPGPPSRNFESSGESRNADRFSQNRKADPLDKDQRSFALDSDKEAARRGGSTRSTASMPPVPDFPYDARRFDGPIGVTLEPRPATGEPPSRARQRTPIRFNISLPSKSAGGSGKAQIAPVIRVAPEESRNGVDQKVIPALTSSTSAPFTTQDFGALLDSVHKPCGDTFGNRRCCKLPPRQRAGTDHCVPYNYGYCGSEMEQLEKPIKFQEECYEVCYTDEEKRSLPVFRDLRFKNGVRIAGPSA